MSEKNEDPKHLLSVATEPGGDVVYIHADRAGLELLRKSIDRLIQNLSKGETDHDHFFSPDWGGWELTATILPSEKDSGCKVVHHIKIYSWDEEWKEKNGL